MKSKNYFREFLTYTLLGGSLLLNNVNCSNKNSDLEGRCFSCEN